MSDNTQPQSAAAASAYVTPDNLIPIGGAASVKALFAQRPHCIHKLWLTHETRKDYGEICQYLAGNKKSYALMHERDLDKELGETSHEGIIAFAHPRQCAHITPARLDQWRSKGEPLLLAPDLDSPQTLARVAALAQAFDLKRVLIDSIDASLAEHPLCYTHARGALEDIRFFTWEGRLNSLLKPLRERFLLVGLGGSGASRPSWGKPLSAPGRPLAIIATDPQHGLSNELIPTCEYRIQLPSNNPQFLSRAEALSPILTWLLSKQKNPTAPEHGFLARQREKKQGKK